MMLSVYYQGHLCNHRYIQALFHTPCCNDTRCCCKGMKSKMKLSQPVFHRFSLEWCTHSRQKDSARSDHSCSSGLLCTTILLHTALLIILNTEGMHSYTFIDIDIRKPPQLHLAVKFPCSLDAQSHVIYHLCIT